MKKGFDLMIIDDNYCFEIISRNDSTKDNGMYEKLEKYWFVFNKEKIF